MNVGSIIHSGSILQWSDARLMQVWQPSKLPKQRPLHRRLQRQTLRVKSSEIGDVHGVSFLTAVHEFGDQSCAWCVFSDRHAQSHRKKRCVEWVYGSERSCLGASVSVYLNGSVVFCGNGMRRLCSCKWLGISASETQNIIIPIWWYLCFHISGCIMMFEFLYSRKTYRCDNFCFLTYLVESCFVTGMIRVIFRRHDFVVHPRKKIYNVTWLGCSPQIKM